MIWALVPVLFIYTVLKFWFSRRKICPDGKRKQKIEAILSNPDKIKYDLKSFDVPKLTGLPFKLMIWLAYTRFGHFLVRPFIMKKSNLYCLSSVHIPENPTYYPVPPTIIDGKDHAHSNQKIVNELVQEEVSASDAEGAQFHLPTVADYVRAYRSGKTTPIGVANAILKAISDSDSTDPPLRAIVQANKSVVLAMATSSTQRWKQGKPLSIMDGVPVAIKEEFRCEPYEFRAGTPYIPAIGEGVPESAMVQKLKKAGALIIGIANMHELGTGTLGSNPHPPHLTARNPYDKHCYPGGSSSGSAVAIAAGFCPVAIGGDGGGSIRIPAAICGTVGLKPTFGLVDALGVMPKVFTVGAPGPLTSSVLDTAITMDIISAETEGTKSLVSLEGLGEKRLDGLKVGIYWDYFKHAEQEIVVQCKAALSHLEKLGAALVDIVIPELEDSRVAHVISIGTEFASSLGQDLDNHFTELNLETHLLVGSSASFSSIDYINAQRQRTRAIAALKDVFEKVDVIATPATGCVAPKILPENVPLGVADGKASGEMMRFAFLANLTGIPGLVLPVGYTASSGLPIGLQLMSPWYQENVLLKVGWALEQSGAFPTRKPQVFYDVISSAPN